MKYEVRCCCNPDKLIGWLETPPRGEGKFNVYFEHNDEKHAVVLEVANFFPAMLNRFTDADLNEAPTKHSLFQGTSCLSSYPAIKDNYVPLETLKSIPGFIANK